MKHRLIKTPEEIKILAQGGKILHDVLQKVAAAVVPGISTAKLNELAEEEIKKAGGIPSFKGYGPKSNAFPAALCTSINDVVVHGIPSFKAILKTGDIIGLDLGIQYQGLFTDSAVTVGVGNISPIAQRLIEVTKQSLIEAIKQAKAGNRIGQISYATQQTAEQAGFSVVRDLVGHGVGYAVHEDPAVPCFGKKSEGIILKAGMVLAIEPMVCAGQHYLEFDDAGWDIRTHDHKLSAHFEHTIAVTEHQPLILT